MLFLREFTHQVAIALLLHVYFNIVVSEDCERTFRQVLVKQERGRPCVYVEKSGLKYIGWKFDLNEGQQVRAVFTRLGADYEQFFKSPATSSDARCECSNVPCLTKRQMDKLLDLSVEGTLRGTLTLVPSLKNLCCSLQSHILLLAFTSGGRIFNDVAASDLEYHIKMQSWLALAQRLNQSEWCRNYQKLCTEQTRIIIDGCVHGGHHGSRDKREINGKSKENATCAENTCRKGKPSTTISSATNNLIPVKPSTSRLIPLGTSSAAAPINAGDPNRDSQFTPKPSHIQMSDVRKITSVSSVATKSLRKDVLPLAGSAQGYFYSVSTVSAKTSPNLPLPHGLTTKGIPEFSIGTKSSVDCLFSITSSSKFVTENAKPSAVMLSNWSKLWSSSASEAERVSPISYWPLQQRSFHHTSSAELKTGMASHSLGLTESPSITSALKTFPTPLSRVLRSKLTVTFEESLFLATSASKTSPSPELPLETPLTYQTRTSLKFAELSSPATPMIHKDWSFSQTYESENSKPSSVVLSNPLKVSKTWSSSLSTEERVSLTSSWPLEQRLTTHGTSFFSKTGIVSSSLGSTKSLLSAASVSKTTIGPESSFETSPSQVLLTPSSLGYLASQVLQNKTSLKFAELSSPTKSVIHDDWSSSLTPGVKFVTERTRTVSMIQSNPSKFSRTWSSLPLEAANVSLTSWPLQQTSFHRTTSVLNAGMTSSFMGSKSQFSAISASRTTTGPALSFETFLSQVLLTSSSLLKYSASTTSASRTSNGSHLSFGRSSLSQVVQTNSSTRFAEFSLPVTAVIHKMDLSSTIKPTPRLVPWQSSLASRTLLYRVSSSISKSWSTHGQQKSELTGSSRLTRLSEIVVTRSIRSSPSLSFSRVLTFYGSSQIPQKWSSAARDILSKRRVPSVHLESVILGSTRSFRNSFIFTSTIHALVSRTSQVVLSNIMNSSRPQTVKPRRSHSPVISSLSLHSSVRASFPEKTIKVHVMSSISSTPARESSLLFFHTASLSSTVILDEMKTTKQTQSITPLQQTQTSSQTRHTLSSVLGVRTMEAVSMRTSDATVWSSSPSAMPLPPPLMSFSSSLTTITKTMANAGSDSLDDKTLGNLQSVPVTEAPPFTSSRNEANSTPTISGVSMTKERPYISQVASSLGLTLGLPLQISSQRTASEFDHPSTPKWTKTSVALTQSLAKKQTGTPLPSSYDLVSAAFILSSSTSVKVPFSKSSSLHSTLFSPVVVPTPSVLPSFSPPELVATSQSVLGSTQYDQTYLVILSGNCAVLENKDDFRNQFKVVLTRLLSVRAADISVLDISCGSVHVMFSVREAKRRNITNKLRDLVKDKAFKFEYNNMIFVALEMSEISRPPETTARPSRTTHTSRTSKAKQIALIIFILALSLFAALTLLLAVIFCARFCRCCQKREKRRKPKKSSVEVELKVFSSLYNNLFRKVDYYGGSRQLATPSKEKQKEFQCEDVEDQPVSTVTALLSETEKVTDEEKKFSFDDDDSCASVLFY